MTFESEKHASCTNACCDREGGKEIVWLDYKLRCKFVNRIAPKEHIIAGCKGSPKYMHIQDKKQNFFRTMIVGDDLLPKKW